MSAEQIFERNDEPISPGFAFYSLLAAVHGKYDRAAGLEQSTGDSGISYLRAQIRERVDAKGLTTYERVMWFFITQNYTDVLAQKGEVLSIAVPVVDSEEFDYTKQLKPDSEYFYLAARRDETTSSALLVEVNSSEAVMSATNLTFRELEQKITTATIIPGDFSQSL